MFDHQEELDQYLENIEALIKNKQYARLRDLFLPMEPADIALLLEEAGEEEMPLLYRLLPKELAAEVFVELEIRQPGDAHQRLFQHRAEGGAGRAVSGRCRGHRGGNARQRGHPHSATRPRRRCASPSTRC